MRVYLDTEFVESDGSPRFISAGFLSEYGHELYSELTPKAVESLLRARPSDFVREHVAPQLGRWPGVPWAELPAALAAWLDALGDADIELIYDYSHDFLLVEQLLEVHGAPPRARVEPVNVSYLLEDQDGSRAAAAAWDALEAVRGLSRHHALADAFALRARFETVHPPAPAPRETGTREVLATVSVVIDMFEVVHAESADGLTVCIGEGTSGVDWRTLVPGQRLRCVVERSPSRVLSAEVLPPPTEQETPSDGD